jgi:drug/metabolite transporter (DMT)-like permease
VPAAALLFALGAALLHASWNVLLARTADPAAAGGVMLLTAPVVFAPAAAATWDVDWAAAPYVAGSAAFELAYFVLLTAAYGRSELSLVYPIARGLAPVAVLAVTTLALSAAPSGAEVAGVVLVGCGIVLVRGRPAKADPRGVLLGVAIAACIAGYTIVDKHGVEHAGPIPYFELVALVTAVAYLPFVAWRRGIGAVRAELRPSTIVSGIFAFAAYGLVLAALERASAASVSAVRETSVVMATALATFVLGERVGLPRLAGSAIVVGGVALIALG